MVSIVVFRGEPEKNIHFEIRVRLTPSTPPLKIRHFFPKTGTGRKSPAWFIWCFLNFYCMFWHYYPLGRVPDHSGTIQTSTRHPQTPSRHPEICQRPKNLKLSKSYDAQKFSGRNAQTYLSRNINKARKHRSRHTKKEASRDTILCRKMSILTKN